MNYKEYDKRKANPRGIEATFNLLREKPYRVKELQKRLGTVKNTTPFYHLKSLGHCIDRKLDTDGRTRIYGLKKRYRNKSFKDIKHLLIKRRRINGEEHWTAPLTK